MTTIHLHYGPNATETACGCFKEDVPDARLVPAEHVLEAVELAGKYARITICTACQVQVHSLNATRRAEDARKGGYAMQGADL